MHTWVVVVALAGVLTASGAAAQDSKPAPAAAAPAPSPLAEELWAAVRSGDVKRVTAVLDKGADVNAKTRYGATALTFAADKGHIDVIKLLIARGADVNAQDTFYQRRAIDMAMANNHAGVVTLLLERGSKGAPGVLMQALQRGTTALVAPTLESTELTRAHLRPALAAAKQATPPELIGLLDKTGVPAADLPSQRERRPRDAGFVKSAATATTRPAQTSPSGSAASS